MALTEGTYLYNTEKPNNSGWGEPYAYIIVPKGHELGLMVETFKDGRVYRTMFIKVNDEFFCCTNLEKDGELFRNCGGHRASSELREHEKNGLFNA